MQWEKKICIRLTTRRILGAILTASTVVNLVIVGAAFEASAPISTATFASVLTLAPSTTAFFIPPSTAGAAIPITGIETPGAIPTEVLTPTDTPISPPRWILCIKRFYWSDYLVQPGDTLYSLAGATGSSVEELMLANCLPDNRIYYGQILYMPRLPIKTFTSTPSTTPTAAPSNTLTETASATPVTITPSVTPTFSPSPTSTNTLTDTPLLAADLVVRVLQVTGPVQVVSEQQIIVVPVYVVIVNQGEATADIFKLSAHYAGPGGKFVAQFLAFDASSGLYPFTEAPLPAGQQITISGEILLPEALQGQTIAISVLADSCSGDKLMPDYCRVAEGNEGNNESQQIGIDLPSNNPPVASITIPAADTNGAFDQDPQYTNYWSAVVDLSGSAIDAEDGVLTGSSLVWSTDRTDIDIYKNNPILGTGTSISPRLYVYVNDCRGHIITLTATDSDGNAAIATRKIEAGCIN